MPSVAVELAEKALVLLAKAAVVLAKYCVELAKYALASAKAAVVLANVAVELAVPRTARCSSWWSWWVCSSLPPPAMTRVRATARTILATHAKEVVLASFWLAGGFLGMLIS